MTDTSRRSFLAITGAGAAALGAAALAPSAIAAAAPSQADAGRLDAGRLEASGPLVAYVSDVRSGRLSVMVGEREVVVHDHDLVARFAHLAASASAR